MAICAPCTRNGMLTSEKAKSCCADAACRGTFGYASAPGMIVTCVGGATSFYRFAFNCGIGVLVTSKVSGVNPYIPGISDVILLRFKLDLI